MTDPIQPELTRYLGDGVYATFDGFGLEIKINDHRNPVAVVLEPDVLIRMVQFLDEHQRKVSRERAV